MLPIQKQIQKKANREKAKIYQQFFKTGKPVQGVPAIL